jgi:hypothetical protein
MNFTCGKSPEREVAIPFAEELLPLLLGPWPSANCRVLKTAGGELVPASSTPATGTRTPHTRIVYSVLGSRLLARN